MNRPGAMVGRAVQWGLAALVLGVAALGGPVERGMAQQGNLAQLLSQGKIPFDPRGTLLPGEGVDQRLKRGGGDGQQRARRERRRAPEPIAEPSRLERLYSNRADRKLRLQGYGALTGPARKAAGSGGGVQDGYVLKVGDRLRVSFYGQKQKRHRVVVDPAGQIAVPPFGPMSAAGRKLGKLRDQLAAETDKAFLETDVYVTLINIDRAGVTVSGHVNAPGARTVPALSDVANAVRAAGGATRTASLRRIELHRNGDVRTVDLYPSLLTDGSGPVPTVRPGDRIVVPAVGPTVAVAGFVQGAGIFELPPGRQKIPASRALAWAGGRIAPQKLRGVVLRLGEDGTERSFTVTDLAETSLRNGDILLVQRTRAIRKDTIAVRGGGDAVSGVYPLDEAGTVAAAIGAPTRLAGDTYRGLAVIERRSRETGKRSFEAVDLAAVLAGEAEAKLTAHDRLILLNRNHIAFLNGEGVRRALAPGRNFRKARRQSAQSIPEPPSQERQDTPPPAPGGQGAETPAPGKAARAGDTTSPRRRRGLERRTTRRSAAQAARRDKESSERCSGLFAVARLQQSAATRLAESAVIEALGDVAPRPPQSCPELFAAQPGLLVYLLERAIVVTGPVAEPGLYPFGGAPSFDRVLDVAGGLLDGATRSTVERVVAGQRAGAAPESFDAGRIWALRAAEVTVAGAVTQPGERQLAGRARLSDILQQRGDLAENAYPFFGVVRRQGQGDFARRTVAFSPAAVLAGKADVPLADGDRVRFFTRSQLYFDVTSRDELPGQLAVGGRKAAPTQAGLNPGTAGSQEASGQAGEGSNAQALRQAVRQGNVQRARQLARQGRQNQADAPRFAPPVRALIRTHLIGMHGAVAQPGFYPVADRVAVAELFAALPGPTSQANLSQVEYTNLTRTGDGQRESGSRRRVDLSTAQARRALYVAPGENLQVPARFSDQLSASARITGEVKQPGSYRLLRGDRLLDLIERAGGLTDQAYIPGAVFLRESVREQRRKAFREASRDLQRELAGLAARGGKRASQANLQAARKLAKDLAETDVQGRVVINGDPQALRGNETNNVLLQDGDRLHYPSRPSHVTVSGEVLAPTALQYKPQRSAVSYLRAAGGTTDFANEDRIFMVMPSGRARALEANVFTFDPPEIKPGTRIVVPREVLPFNLQRFTTSLAGVARDLSITAQTQQQLTQ